MNAIMKNTFKQRWSRQMTFEIEFLSWDRINNVFVCLLIMSFHPLANEVAKGYSNATVRPSFLPSVRPSFRPSVLS